MPLPKPSDDESEAQFIDRCMDDETMIEDFPDSDQRLGVCFSQWRAEDDKGIQMDKIFGRAIEVKEIEDSGSFVGYGSIFNEIDSYRDQVAPGAFKKSLKSKTPKLLWQHDSREPIGVYKEVKEDDKGLFVHGQLDLGVQRAREAHSLLRSGAVEGLSIGFVTVKDEMDRDTEIRTLTEVDLWEVSLVTFPALASAQVTAVKEQVAAGGIPGKRTLEALLREAGLSRSQATAFVSRGYGAAFEDTPRDAEDEGQAAEFVRAMLLEEQAKLFKESIGV